MEDEYIRISSKYTVQKWLRVFLKDTVHKSLKCAGVLLRPSGMTTYSKRPNLSLKCSPVVIIRVHFNLVITTC